jgi:hypothetical protein
VPWLTWNINNPKPLLSKDHLTNLNLNNFKMIQDMGLIIIASRSLEWNYLCTIPNFMKIYQAVRKLLVGGTQTDSHLE